MTRESFRRALIRSFLALGAAAMVTAANTPKPAATLKSELSDLFKGKTARMVWQKDTEGGWPGFQPGAPNKLLKMHSGEGIIRDFVLNKGYMARPTFTWDGERVVFTDLRSSTIYVAKWSDGTCIKVISGYEAGGCYFFENKHWVLANVASPGAIYRINIDNPSEKVKITDKQGIWPSISPDGKYLAGLWPTWGHAGVLNISTGTLKEFSNPAGCWPTMYRDNSHYTIYTIEPHRNYRVVDPTERQIFNKPVGESLLPGRDDEYNILRGTMDPDIFTFMICLPGNNPYIERVSDGKYVVLNTGTSNPDEGNMDIHFEGGTTALDHAPRIIASTAPLSDAVTRTYDLRGRLIASDVKPMRAYVQVTDQAPSGRKMTKMVR